MQKLMIWAVRCGQSTPKVRAISSSCPPPLVSASRKNAFMIDNPLRLRAHHRWRSDARDAALSSRGIWRKTRWPRRRQWPGSTWTKTGVAAPGLRPTASTAFMPMRPTPKAAPMRRQRDVQVSGDFGQQGNGKHFGSPFDWVVVGFRFRYGRSRRIYITHARSRIPLPLVETSEA